MPATFFEKDSYPPANFCKNFKNIYFVKRQWVAASAVIRSQILVDTSENCVNKNFMLQTSCLRETTKKVLSLEKAKKLVHVFINSQFNYLQSVTKYIGPGQNQLIFLERLKECNI